MEKSSRIVISPGSRFAVRQTRPEDFSAIREITQEVYPLATPWTPEQLASHLRLFPEGQFVAVDSISQTVVGMTACLIISWPDYDPLADWNTFTSWGTFDNHDPQCGHTLYGAETMVRPAMRGLGIGKLLYAARQILVRNLNLPHIRGGSRLQNYSRYAGQWTAEEYVGKVCRRELEDSTLSFQIKDGFRVLRVVPNYFQDDPECLGYAAVVEWVNPFFLSASAARE